MEASDTTQGAPPADPTSVEGMLQQIQADQAAHRAEVANLRSELSASRKPAATAPVTVRSQADMRADRIEQMSQFDYYCPGCGRLYSYPRECTGDKAMPHAPVEVVSTSEVTGTDSDPANHTAAPNT